MFKKRRSIRLNYKKQGLVYFICINHRDMPPQVQEKILRLCRTVAGEDADALHEFLTNENTSATGVSLRYYINEKRLYALRRRFYEEWYNS